ncbi:Unknown protein [Striga hermonthica]|uniref:CCHC-type domain-containing protein n=1 Tax=Striga hermonthica TaxID=68872 RepID=A0A9N7R9K3_STRHE|nr:Unknown protein [Striga hermonthica]
MFRKVSDVFVPESGSISGRWLKILVSVNLNEPLLRGANIKVGQESVWVSFRYENLQAFCYYCGRIGHSERNCCHKREDIKNNKHRPRQYGEWIKASSGSFHWS